MKIYLPVIVSFILFSTCGLSSAAEKFAIFYTGSVEGEIEPCGCKIPLGGLARKATVFQSYLKQYENSLILDAGDLFFKSPKISDSQIELKQETGLFIIDIYNELGYQVYNVSGKDLCTGLEFVKSAEKRVRFPFISANILDLKTHNPIFEPYVILKSGSNKFGIIGVTSKPQCFVEGVEFGDPLEVVRQYLPRLKKKVDYIILLAAVNNSDETKIVGESIPVEFLLRADTYRRSESINTTNGINVVRCGNLGKYVGILSVNIVDKKKPFQDVSKIKSQIKYVDKKLKSFSREMGDKTFDEYYADKQNILRMIRTLQNQEKELKKKREKIVNVLDFELVFLDEDVEDDPSVRSKINKHEKIVGKMKVKARK